MRDRLRCETHDLRSSPQKLRVESVPCSLDQLAAARRAFRRFGKGRHPAGLNCGDCFSYALARTSGEPAI